jgi:5-methyltetrahydrofolate--homocysteine methyltransferase
VGMMLTGAGFRVVDLGINVSPQAFADAVTEHAPQVVGLSALLTTTMTQMRPTLEAIRDVAPGACVLVGGAPVTAEYAAEIGADGYGANAAEAVDEALRLVARRASG